MQQDVQPTLSDLVISGFKVYTKDSKFRNVMNQVMLNTIKYVFWGELSEGVKSEGIGYILKSLNEGVEYIFLGNRDTPIADESVKRGREYVFSRIPDDLYAYANQVWNDLALERRNKIEEIK